MQSNTSNRIIKAISIISISVFVVFVIRFVVSFVSFVMSIMSIGSSEPAPTDKQMIEHFNSHKELFEELCSMIEHDLLSSYPLLASEKEEGEILSIPADRQAEYDSLMKKLHITWFYHPEWYHNRSDKTIRFYYWGKGDATWGIDKGFEYVPDRSNEGDKEFIEGDLSDTARERGENCSLYKKINDQWNLLLIYDR